MHYGLIHKAVRIVKKNAYTGPWDGDHTLKWSQRVGKKQACKANECVNQYYTIIEYPWELRWLNGLDTSGLDFVLLFLTINRGRIYFSYPQNPPRGKRPCGKDIPPPYVPPFPGRSMHVARQEGRTVASDLPYGDEPLPTFDEATRPTARDQVELQPDWVHEGYGAMRMAGVWSDHSTCSRVCLSPLSDMEPPSYQAPSRHNAPPRWERRHKGPCLSYLPMKLRFCCSLRTHFSHLLSQSWNKVFYPPPPPPPAVTWSRHHTRHQEWLITTRLLQLPLSTLTMWPLPPGSGVANVAFLLSCWSIWSLCLLPMLENIPLPPPPLGFCCFINFPIFPPPPSNTYGATDYSHLH